MLKDVGDPATVFGPKETNHNKINADLGLPDIAGDSLVRQLRAAAGRRVPVAVITGYGEPYLSRARQAGADAVFTKPVEWTLILDYLCRPSLAASA